MGLFLLILGSGCTRARPVPPTPTPTPTPLATPTLAPTFTPTPEPYIAYTVAQGDSLWSIAVEFEVTVEELLEANDLSPDTILEIGQELSIPKKALLKMAVSTPSPSAAGATYTVGPGDTLWDIALRFGVTVEALAQANGLSNLDQLEVGQELIIPQ